MRLYTLLDNGHAALTINADNEQEARRVLAALGVLGDGCAVRRATADEVSAWRTSATQPRELLRRLVKKTPAPEENARASQQTLLQSV